eukprot:g10488.t1
MVLRELSESEWQHSFVSVLKLAGSSGSSRKPDTTRVLGDVKQIMDKTIGRRALRISGPVSAANYWEAKTAPLNLTGRFVYIQVRPIGDKVMTFHLDVLDAGGQPERVTFSTLYSAPPLTPTGTGGSGGFFKRSAAATATATIAAAAGGNRVSTLGGSTKHGNGATGASSGTTLEAWKSGGAGTAWAATKGGEATATAADAAGGAALAKRGGALRYPVSFDTSRSRGWSVVAIDMAAVMREGDGRGAGGGGGNKGYGLLKAVRLGSNMVVRGVYASDCVYSPHTLPKEMAFRAPGGGLDWETAYNWLWLPEVPDENAAPPRDGTRQTTRPAWPPGADSPSSSVAAANAADAHERRRMEKRHFFADPGTIGKLIAQQGSEADHGEATAETAAAKVTPSRGRSAVPGIRGRAAGKARRDSGGVSVGAAFPRTPIRNGEDDHRRGRSASVRRTPLGSPRAPYPGGGGGGRGGSGGAPPFPRQPITSPISSPARMVRPSSAASFGGGGGGGGGGSAAPSPSPRSRSARSVSRPRNRLSVAPSPKAAGSGSGKPPLSPRRQTGGTPAARGRAFFSNYDGTPDAGVGGARNGGGGGGADDGVEAGGYWNWTREELEAWPGREPAPATPVVSVLPDGGGEEEKGEGEGEGQRRENFGRGRGGVASGGGMDPPVLTRVLPPGLEPSRPDPPEFDPDPALRLERALCYTGGLPSTLAFIGPEAEFMAFPCNNVIVLTDTPVMPEAEFSEHGDVYGGREGFSVGKEGRGEEAADGLLAPQPQPPPQLFLRGHTDTVTHLQLSHAGHLLASAQGDSLGAAGGHGVVRLWDAATFGRTTRGRGGGRSGGGSGGKCAAHFIAHRWGVSSLCFSSDDRLLCTVGGDEHRRTQVIVWDVALLCTARAGTVHGAGSGLAVVARQISDFPITKMLFSPFEKLRLVSCGRENVRFWRVRRRHLPACPAVLNDFARDLECTDLAFQSSCRGIAGVEQEQEQEQEDRANRAEGTCVVYVSSRAGTVLQVSYHTRNLLCVLRLHDGPILYLEVKEDYAVTGSEDKLLRLWPLDFSDFLMEAAHESSVVSVCSSKDGMKLVVGTSAGSIGVLDVMTHGYTTCLRSHRGGVTAAAIDPFEERYEFATVSEDCTIRVWDLVAGIQRYQFTSPSDQPVCVVYAPSTTTVPRGEEARHSVGDGDVGATTPGGGGEAAGEERHLVAGYVSGAVRVFDVPSTSTLYEFQEHRGAVQQVVFTPDGTRVISAGEDGLLCLYDVSRGYHPIRVMACDEPQPGRPIGLSVSPGSDRLAVIGTEPSCILLYDLATMVLKGRLGKPGHRGGRFLSGVGGGGGGTFQPWRHRSGSFDGAGGAVVADSGAAAAGGGFLQAAFSGDGADLLACTATKFFRFPLGGGDVHAWSALLPCKSGPAIAACHPSTGPGLILVSPAPTASTGDLGWAAGAGGGGAASGSGGGGGGKRGAPPRALGGGGSALAPSELFLSQIHRDERSASVVLSAPQAFAAHASPVTVAVFSAGGDRLVTCDGTGVVLLWSNLAAPEPDAWAASARPRAAATDGGGGDGDSLGAGPSGGSGKFFGGQHGEGDYLEAERVEEIHDAGALEEEQELGKEKEREEETQPLRLEVLEEGRAAPEARADEGREVEKASPRGRAGAAPGLRPTTSPMEFKHRGGRSRGYASMLDQTPPPTMQTAGRGFTATEGRTRANQRTAPGQLEKAIKALQTVVDDAAAVVVDGENGDDVDGGGRGEAIGPRQPTHDGGQQQQRRFEPAELACFDEGDDCEDDGDYDGIEADWRGGNTAGECAAKTRPISPRAPFASSKEHHPVTREVTAAMAAAAATSTGATTCVTWHPASARLIYAEGASLFAEDLGTCRRWALSSTRDSGGGGGRGVARTSSCVAVSADGSLVARGTTPWRPAGPGRGGGGSGDSCLSVWRLGRDVIRKPRMHGLSYGEGNGEGEARRRRPSWQADATVVSAREDIEVGVGGVAALAFSPSGSDLCSVGEWDGGKCLLKVHPTSGLVGVDSPTTRGPSSPPLRRPVPARAAPAACEGFVTQLAAQTSAICMLPTTAERREAASPPMAAGDAREPFLFVTGGNEGVALWRRVFDDARRSGGTASSSGGSGRTGGGVGRGRGGVRLLGTSAGWKATALASVGRFVVGADVVAPLSEGAPPVRAEGSATVTAIDVNWLAAGDHEAGMQVLVGDEECTWGVLRGSGDGVAITCLASAGPRKVAVGGSGGKLEIWDVEAVCAGGAGCAGVGGGEASAGLVHRLDLGDALEGASVTDMTWDAGGTDAVLGASGRGGAGGGGGSGDGGGGIWHLRLPQGVGGEPTLARLWPGGNLKT